MSYALDMIRKPTTAEKRRRERLVCEKRS